MGLADILLSKLAKYDSETQSLLISGTVTEKAIKITLGCLSEIKKSEVSMVDDRIETKLVLKDGKKIAMKLIPKGVSISPERFFAEALLPEGIAIGHEKMILNFLIAIFDGIFGLSRRALNSVPGVNYTENKVSYSRALSDSPFLTLLYKLSHSGKTLEVPIQITTGWLHLDLSECGSVPKFDISSIVAVLIMS